MAGTSRGIGFSCQGESPRHCRVQNNVQLEANMPEKVIGVLGGMGPEATYDFYGKLIRLTPATRDQDHLRVIIDSNPKVPDRTQAILHGGPSPVPLLVEGARRLHLAGADFIVIPCVSAHYFLDELSGKSPLPIISILDATIEEIKGKWPWAKRVGLLGTKGTLQGGHFQRSLASRGLETLVPGERDQELLMKAIYCVKASQEDQPRKEMGEVLKGILGRLAERGAELAIAGCTELPMIVPTGYQGMPIVDPLLALARAAIRKAGLNPL